MKLFAPCHLAGVLALCIPFAPAQATHYVQGPNLQAAINAAAPGDVILVSGAVASFPALIIDKPLHIHGQPGATLQGAIEIRQLAAGASTVLSSFGQTGQQTQVVVSDCAGLVLIADMPTKLRVMRSSRVAIDGVRVLSAYPDPDVVCFDSTLLITRCELRGEFGTFWAPTSALSASNSTVVAVDTSFVGGASRFIGHPTQPGIDMFNSNVRLTGTCRVVAGGSFTSLPVVEAVRGTGSLTHGTGVVFQSPVAPPIQPGIVVRVLDLAVTSINTTALGEQATVRVRGGAGDPFALLFGLPGRRTQFAGIEGELWVQAPALLAIGALDPAGRFSLSFSVPNAELLRAIQFAWQAITFPAAGNRFAEAAIECHR